MSTKKLPILLIQINNFYIFVYIFNISVLKKKRLEEIKRQTFKGWKLCEWKALNEDLLKPKMHAE